jgi:hypothetical protein
MKVLLSWSGERSKQVALALRDWLREVVQSLQPWMSTADVNAGARWTAEISKALSETRVGILCLTTDNLDSPWLLFEAGALAKTIDSTFVCPYLLDLKPAAIPNGPLSQFQAKSANKAETLDLMKMLSGQTEQPLTDDMLTRAFERCWSTLEENLAKIPKSAAPARPRKTEREILEEVLVTVRGIERKLPPPGSLAFGPGLNLPHSEGLLVPGLGAGSLSTWREPASFGLPPGALSGIASALTSVDEKTTSGLAALLQQGAPKKPDEPK